MRLNDLARITKIGYQTLWGRTNGGVRKRPPNVEQALRIAEVLKKNVDDFISV